MTEHWIHFILLFGVLLSGLLIWFWDAMREVYRTRRINIFSLRNATVLTLLVFSLVHFLPTVVIMTHEHQSHDQTSEHPCCAPQSITAALPVVTMAPPIWTEEYLAKKAKLNVHSSNIISPNSRSPPETSV